MIPHPIEHSCHFGTVAVVKVEAPRAVEKEHRALFVKPISRSQHLHNLFGTSDSIVGYPGAYSFLNHRLLR